MKMMRFALFFGVCAMLVQTQKPADDFGRQLEKIVRDFEHATGGAVRPPVQVPKPEPKPAPVVASPPAATQPSAPKPVPPAQTAITVKPPVPDPKPATSPINEGSYSEPDEVRALRPSFSNFDLPLTMAKPTASSRAEKTEKPVQPDPPEEKQKKIQWRLLGGLVAMCCLGFFFLGVGIGFHLHKSPHRPASPPAATADGQPPPPPTAICQRPQRPTTPIDIGPLMVVIRCRLRHVAGLDFNILPRSTGMVQVMCPSGDAERMKAELSGLLQRADGGLDLREEGNNEGSAVFVVGQLPTFSLPPHPMT